MRDWQFTMLLAVLFGMMVLVVDNFFIILILILICLMLLYWSWTFMKREVEEFRKNKRRKK